MRGTFSRVDVRMRTFQRWPKVASMRQVVSVVQSSKASLVCVRRRSRESVTWWCLLKRQRDKVLSTETRGTAGINRIVGGSRRAIEGMHGVEAKAKAGPRVNFGRPRTVDLRRTGSVPDTFFYDGASCLDEEYSSMQLVHIESKDRLARKRSTVGGNGVWLHAPLFRHDSQTKKLR